MTYPNITLPHSSHLNETDVDDPRSRQHTAWEPPIPVSAKSTYGAPDCAPVIPNKSSALRTYADGTQPSYAVPPQQKYEQSFCHFYRIW